MLPDMNYTNEHRFSTSVKHVDALSRNITYNVTQDNLTLKIIIAYKINKRHFKSKIV